MKVVRFAVVILAASIAAVPAFAAGPCPSTLSANNPAFGAPRPCPTTSAPVKPSVGSATKSSAASAPAKVTTENGRTVYTTGDTTISVGGHLSVDAVAGKGGFRP